VLAAAALIYLNGTFIHAPYGGTSFAGRFEWSSLVPLLIWCPFAIAAIDRVGRRVWGLALAAVLLWGLQTVPLLTGTHQYYNQQLAPGSPWDPAGYPGWWGPVDRLLPVMVPGGRQFGVPWFGLLVGAALVALGTAAVALATHRAAVSPSAATPATVAVVAAVAAVAALVAVAPLPLPSGPLDFSGTDVGSPIAGGPAGRSVTVALQGVSRGTFRVAVDYGVEGPPGSAVQAFCTRGSDGSRAASTSSVVDTGAHSATMTLSCPAGTIGFSASVLPGTTLTVRSVEVRKTASY
jgi:hypothetical protein